MATTARIVPQPTSRRRSLAVAAGIVAFGFIGSRILGVVRSSAISWAFGSEGDVEAYFVAFRIPDLIFQVLAGATLGSAFIPVFARLTRRAGDDRAWELASGVLNIIMIATGALCVLGFVLAPWLVPATAPGLDPALTNKAIDLTRIMLLSPFFFAISGIVTGILNGRQQFFLPALSPMLYNLAIILGAVVLSRPWGIEGLAAGVVIGSALHLLVQVPGLVRERMRYEPRLGLSDPDVREVGRLMAPRVIGLAASQLNFVVTIFFASRVGDGAIAALSFAWLVSQLPLALFGMAISTAVFPTLAEQADEDPVRALPAMISRMLRVIMVLTLPAALGLALLAEPVVRVLFERGEFDAEATRVTASALAFYCIGIVPQAGIEIHSRGFYSIGNTATPVTFTVIAMVVNLVLSAILWSPFGADGLALALSLAAWLEWLGLWTMWLRRTGSDPRPDLNRLARMALAAASMGLLVAIALLWLKPSGGQLESLVTIAAAASAGALVYFALSTLLRVDEAEELTSRFERIVRARLRPG